MLIFNFWGRVFSDWDSVIGILDSDYVIWDDYLLFEGEKTLVFNCLFCILGKMNDFGNICVCIFDAVFCVFDGLFGFGMVHFRGPIVRGPICHFLEVDSWAPDSWAPGPNLPFLRAGQLGPDPILNLR